MRESDHIVNRTRMLTIGVLSGAVAAGMAALAVQAAAEDPVGVVVAGGFAAVAVGMALRAPLVGLWIRDDSVVVRRWLGTRTVARVEVGRCDLVSRKGQTCPALILRDGSQIPVAGLEVGLIHEANMDRTEHYVNRINERLRLRREGGGGSRGRRIG